MFRQPEKIIQTGNIQEVQDCLSQIEKITRQQQLFAAGFLAYEAAAAFDPAMSTFSAGNFPLLWFGLYPAPQIMADEAFEEKFFQSKRSQEKLPIDWDYSIDRQAYLPAIRDIKSAIARGDTYQVNYTFRQLAAFSGDPFAFFQAIAANAPYAAFVDTGEFAICSASPELFFSYHQGKIISRPMKGTIKRGMTLAEDTALKETLFHSQKDRAENAMIVDMIRNDMGRIASVGSVQVARAFSLEKYPTLWQMTSTVAGETNAGISQIFSALFPCASITGAPKISTMRIIRALENTPRKIYTGTIGYITPEQNAQFNVAIRTALVDKPAKRIEYGIGSGIVWDSAPKQEYAECLLKATIVKQKQPANFSLLETMLWTPENGVFLLEAHLKRLQNSAKYFDFTCDLSEVKHALTIVEEFVGIEKSPLKLRLLLNPNGTFKIEHYSLNPDVHSANPNVCLAKKPVNSKSPFLYHKTTHREVYERIQEDHPGYADVILWNERNQITEFCLGNIVIQKSGRFLTPPLGCGLLAGTFRQHLLEKKEIETAIITRRDLRTAEAIYRINSVRKWERVHFTEHLQMANLM